MSLFNFIDKTQYVRPIRPRWQNVLTWVSETTRCFSTPIRRISNNCWLNDGRMLQTSCSWVHSYYLYCFDRNGVCHWHWRKGRLELRSRNLNFGRVSQIDISLISITWYWKSLGWSWCSFEGSLRTSASIICYSVGDISFLKRFRLSNSDFWYVTWKLTLKLNNILQRLFIQKSSGCTEKWVQDLEILQRY